MCTVRVPSGENTVMPWVCGAMLMAGSRKRRMLLMPWSKMPSASKRFPDRLNLCVAGIAVAHEAEHISDGQFSQILVKIFLVILYFPTPKLTDSVNILGR